jgi:hypothetical protein
MPEGMRGMMSINYKNLPLNFKSEIRPRILERAKYKCEKCGVADCSPLQNAPYRVVLSIVHKDGMFTDHTDSNLLVVCQECRKNKNRKIRRNEVKK